MRMPLLFVLLVGCGGGGDDSADGNSVANRYLPWTVGSVWKFKLTDKQTGGVKLDQPTTIMRMEDVGGVHAGKQALVVHYEQYSGSKDVWENIEGDLDVRYMSKFYDGAGALTSTDVNTPYRLKLDESAAHTTTGAAWTVTYSESTDGAAPASRTENWLVVNGSESVTVMAGTFDALHVRRTSNSGTIQDYWYARGVGKLKETGGGQDEELMSYTIAP